MVSAARKHVDELLKLSPDERLEAAEILLASLKGDLAAAKWADLHARLQDIREDRRLAHASP